jgi:LSD1 subclass zinc finger protein
METSGEKKKVQTPQHSCRQKYILLRGSKHVFLKVKCAAQKRFQLHQANCALQLQKNDARHVMNFFQ